MSEPRIQVAEQFYSLQGEGPSAGEPAIFLRLAGCNLSCGWDGELEDYEPGDEPMDEANWVCDSIDVWREAANTYTPDELYLDWKEKGWLEHIRHKDAHVVLTGGEPTLPNHQKAFAEFGSILRKGGYDPYLEVETNGTQEITPPFAYHVDHYNVSLKLSNSGMDEDRRVIPDHVNQYVDMGDGVATFKFVIGDEEDLVEVEHIIDEFVIPQEQVSLMPAGQTREQLRETYPLVAEACKETGYRFTPRLQVSVWGQVTGV